MKCILPEFEALQSGHGMRDGRMDRRTDGQMDGLMEWNRYTPSNFIVWGYNKAKLEQLERLHSEIPPTPHPQPPYDYSY